MSTGKSELGRFFKHSGIYAIGNVLNRAGALLLLPVYTNYLTVAEYGALEVFYVLATVVSGLLAAGIAHATLRFYFEYDEERDRNAVVSSNLIFGFVIASTGSLLVGLWHRELVQFVFGDTRYQAGIFIILATLVLELSSQVSLAYVRARERSMMFVLLALAKLLIQVSANVYFVIYAGKGVVGVLTGNLLAVAAGWVFLSAFTLRHCGLRFELAKVIPSFRYSFPFLLSTMLGIVSVNADRFLINSLLSLEALGLYALALKFSHLLEQLVGEPFNRSYGAFRFSIMRNTDVTETQALILRYLLAASVAAGLGISLFARDLLAVMSDKAYWPAADLLPVLMLAAVLQVMTYPLQTGFLYAKKTRHILHIGMTSALTSVVSILLLIQAFGLIGACLGQVVVSSISVWLTNRLSQRYFRVNYDLRRLIHIVALAVVAYLASLPLSGLAWWIALPAKGILYLAFLFALFRTGCFTHAEIGAMRDFLRRRFAGDGQTR